MLSKRNAYPSIGGRQRHSTTSREASSSTNLCGLWLHADGTKLISRIAKELQLDVSETLEIAAKLEAMELVARV